MFKRAVIIVAMLYSAIAVRGQEPYRTAGDRPVDIHHIRLELDVQLKEKRIAGSATIDFTTLRALRTLKLDAVDLQVSGVSGGDGQRLPFVNTGEQVLIDLGAELPRGQTRRVVIHYQAHDPSKGLYFFGPTEAEPDVPLTVWSQGETIYNRYWFPCIDHPNEQQTSEMIVTVDAGFEALSNGELVSKKTTPEGRTIFHWRQNRPHVSYLVTLAVAEYVVTTEEWRGRPVTYYVPPPRAQDTQRTFGRTVAMLDFFSDRFGIEYPWEKYAQVVVEQFIMGGMENTSATTLTETALHDERAFIDSSPDWLIAHELGHQWWGDLVTCKDWSHLWLNEGFATYCEVLWAEHHLGRDEMEYRLVEKGRSARSGSAKARSVVDRHYPDPDSMFDSRVYPKGGWILHMLRSQLGDELFFESIRQYGTKFSHSVAETSDLRQVMEEHTGRTLERFFHDWTQRPGHPQLEVASSYEADDKLVKIQITQKQKEEAFEFPLHIELVMPGDKTIAVDKLVSEKELTFYVPAAARPKAVRVDPNLTLLADLEEKKSRDWWVAQAKAPGVAERIRAVEHFGKSKTAADRKVLADVLKNDGFFGVRVEAARALGKSGGDDSRDALLAGLNNAGDARVRSACAEALSTFFNDRKVIGALNRKNAAGDASYFVEADVVAALGKVHPNPPLKPLEAALAKDSHRQVIRNAALRSMAYSTNRRALDVLVEWTQRGKPRDCRRAAITSLATHLRSSTAPQAVKSSAIETLIGFLSGESDRIRRAAVDALRDLGSDAEPATRVLESLAEHDPDARVRRQAEAALEKIRAETPAQAEVARLRKELDELRKSRQSLEERLDKIETKTAGSSN